jgi:hypothetical protein
MGIKIIHEIIFLIDKSYEYTCCTPFYKECSKHHRHKGDLGVTPETCDANVERAQVFLVWLRASCVGNASHPQRLEVVRVRPHTMRKA